MVKKILRDVEVTKPKYLIFNRVIVLVVFVVGSNVLGNFLLETLIRYFHNSFIKFYFISIGNGVVALGFIIFLVKLSHTLDCYACRNKRWKVYLLQIVLTVILIVVIVGLIRN